MRSIQATAGNCDRNHLELTATSNIFIERTLYAPQIDANAAMSLLESLNDPNRHSQQPNSFAAVQTTWNKSGTKPPKPQTNTNQEIRLQRVLVAKRVVMNFKKRSLDSI